MNTEEKKRVVVKLDDDGIDESIFLLIQNNEPREYFWYVIEDKRIHGHDHDHDLLELNEVDVDFTNKGSIDIVTASIRDRIRAFRLPVISDNLDTARFVVLNSCIYLIGGCVDVVQFCDLKLIKKGWQQGPSLDFPAMYETVAATKTGSILTDFNLRTHQNDCLWLNSLSSEGCKHVPKPPYKICPRFGRVDNPDRWSGRHVSLVGLTDTKGFWHVPQNLDDEGDSSLICFDFVKWEWEFLANVSNDCEDLFKFQGVVLYDSYLFLYGIPNESEINKNEKKKFTLCAYDLIERRFISEPVTCDDHCTELLPQINMDYNPRNLCHLFKVCDNKLAFVWKRDAKAYGSHNVVYWTKLTIHKKSNGNELGFHGEVSSHGQCVINGIMIGCAVRVTVREEHEGILAKTKPRKECRKMVDQEFNDPEFNNIQNATSDSRLYSLLDRLCSSIESQKRDLPGCSIHEVVKVLRGLPGIVKGDELFLKAVKCFTKRENREAFNALQEPDLQVAWLKLMIS